MQRVSVARGQLEALRLGDRANVRQRHQHLKDSVVANARTEKVSEERASAVAKRKEREGSGGSSERAWQLRTFFPNAPRKQRWCVVMVMAPKVLPSEHEYLPVVHSPQRGRRQGGVPAGCDPRVRTREASG